MGENGTDGEETSYGNQCVDKDSMSERCSTLNASTRALLPDSSIYVKSSPKGSISQSLTGYSRGSWISGLNSSPSSLQDYSRFPSKRGSFTSVYNSGINLKESQTGTMYNSYYSFGAIPQHGAIPQQVQTSGAKRSSSVSNSAGTDQMFPPYPYNGLGMYSVCETPPSSPSTPTGFYPPYSVVPSCGFPLPPSAGFNCVCPPFYPPFRMCCSYSKPNEMKKIRGSSTVAIDNKIENKIDNKTDTKIDSKIHTKIDTKIEQAMDLVKSHLMYAVREEVEVLKEQIKELIEKNLQLKHENNILKAAASPKTLALLNQPRQSQPPASSS